MWNWQLMTWVCPQFTSIILIFAQINVSMRWESVHTELLAAHMKLFVHTFLHWVTWNCHPFTPVHCSHEIASTVHTKRLPTDTIRKSSIPLGHLHEIASRGSIFTKLCRPDHTPNYSRFLLLIFTWKRSTHINWTQFHVKLHTQLCRTRHHRMARWIWSCKWLIHGTCSLGIIMRMPHGQQWSSTQAMTWV